MRTPQVMTCALILALTLSGIANAAENQTAPAATKSESNAGRITASGYRAAHLGALTAASNGDLKGAIRALQALAAKKMPQSDRDRVLLSAGRLQYELGKFSDAIATYAKVSRTGPSWMEALEETAWAEFRAGRPQETIARLKTVTSPAFKEDTKSEPLFLLGLAQLRVCDYKAVFKTIELFKTRFADKAKVMEASGTAKDKASLTEIGDTVQKLNLVEAEVIQRLYVDENGKKRGGSTPSVSRGSDQLSFPSMEDDEFWLDEVDGYKVSLKGCLPPAPKAKSVATSAVQTANEAK